MSASVVKGRSSQLPVPELEGVRVLITGLTAAHGVDLARGFADHRCRIVAQMPDSSIEAEVLLEVLAQSAGELKASSQSLDEGPAALAFAQGAAQAFNGLDIVVNLITLDGAGLKADASVDEIERHVADRLRSAFHITRVAANRMRTTWVEGLVLNVLYAPSDGSETGIALACIARAALAGMTRAEAGLAADNAVRVNAIGPRDLMQAKSRSEHALKTETDIAALALFLASKRGKALTGITFDLEEVVPGCC